MFDIHAARQAYQAQKISNNGFGYSEYSIVDRVTKEKKQAALPNMKSVEKTAVFELTYLFLQLTIYTSIAHALKGSSLKFLINLLDAKKVNLVLLQRNLTAFSFFCKHVATYLRL